MADHDRRGKRRGGYRTLLWMYAAQDFLGIDRPERHLALVPVRQGMTVVDWACGPGRYEPGLAKAVGPSGKVYAVDIEPMAIRAVERRVAKHGLTNVTPFLTEGYSAPIESGSVDIVVFLDAFHAVDDRVALLREFHRILKPEGLLFMEPGHIPMPEATEAIARSGAFTVSRVEGTHLFLSPA